MKKNRICFKIAAVLLVFAILSGVIGQCPVYASTAIVDSGEEGGIRWELDTDGVLSFRGTGTFPEHGVMLNMPWKPYREEIKKVVFHMSSVEGGSLNNYFGNCINLQSVNNIPSGVESMLGTFRGCKSLTSVGTIPDSVLVMHATFWNCTSLNQEIVIPENVTNLMQAFSGCTSLTKTPVIMTSQIPSLYETFRDTAISASPKLPHGIEDMAYAFYGCSHLRSAPELPSTVTDLSYTFYGCKAMTDASAIPGGVTTMSNCFNGCSFLSKAPTIGSNVLENMEYAFYNCSYMETVPMIPESVENIAYAFYGCSYIESAPDVPPNVKHMAGCFAKCGKVSGAMTVYAVIDNAEDYEKFAGDTALSDVVNAGYLGGKGTGLRVNYVNNNKDLIGRYLSRGWNSGTLGNTDRHGTLSVGDMVSQSISFCVVAPVSEAVYTGEKIMPEPELYYAGIKLQRGVDYSVGYINNVNAGIATMNLYGINEYEGNRSIYFTIQKAKLKSVRAYEYSGTYDGNPHSITVTCDDGARVEYGTQEGQYTTEICPQYTLPGTYTTYYRVTKPNYETCMGSSTVKIDYKELNVVSQGFSGEYDGNPHSISLTTEEGAVIRYGTSQGKYTTTICPSYTNVGTYTVYFEVSKTGYATFTGKRQVIIKRKKVEEVEFPKAVDVAYGKCLDHSVLEFAYNRYGTFSWQLPDVRPEVGTSSFALVFTPDDILNYDFDDVDGYNETTHVIVRDVSVTVVKADPDIPTPLIENMVYRKGSTLRDITLPAGWSWKDETTYILPGENKYTAIYIPEDLKNYNILEREILVNMMDENEEPVTTLSPPEDSPEPERPFESERPSEPQKTKEPQEPKEPQVTTEPSMIRNPQGTSEKEVLEEILQPNAYSDDENLFEQTLSAFLKDIEYNGAEKVELSNGEVPKVKIKNALYRNKKIRVSWKKVNEASGYQVFCSAKKSMSPVLKKENIRKLSIRLKWGKHRKCYVKVRAFRICNGKKVYGKWSKVRCVKITG